MSKGVKAAEAAGTAEAVKRLENVENADIVESPITGFNLPPPLHSG